MEKVSIIFPKIGIIHYNITDDSFINKINIVSVDEIKSKLTLINNISLNDNWWGIENYENAHLVILWGIFKNKDDHSDYLDYKEKCDELFDSKFKIDAYSISNKSLIEYINRIENCLIKRLKYISIYESQFNGPQMRGIWKNK